MRPRARHLLWVAGLALLLAPVVLWLAMPFVLSVFAGGWKHAPAEMQGGLGPEARALLERVGEGLDPERLVDVHVHVAGLGTDGSGCWVSPDMLTLLHPVRWAQFRAYLHASGVRDRARADREYVERLAELARHHVPPARLGLLAFDHHYTADGTRDLELSPFHVPNEWVFRVADEQPELFLPVMSVHPYRADALEELDRWADRGGRLLKWLPNAMGIDPADPRCDPFYARMRERGVILLCHTGLEQAVHAEEFQRLGNPLRLRRALDAGVTVIVAHCASFGEGEDLDHPDRPIVPLVGLFLRMMDEERYEGLLFGELSAITLANRMGDELTALLERTDLHERFVNGSDYPLPAIDSAVLTGELVRRGFLAEEDRAPLNEIYEYNPLVFDLALKRCLRSPEGGQSFAAEAFLVPAELGL